MYQTRNVNICQKTFLEYFQFNLSLSYYKKKKKKNTKFYQSMERLRKIKKKIVVLYSSWIVYRLKCTKQFLIHSQLNTHKRK